MSALAMLSEQDELTLQQVVGSLVISAPFAAAFVDDPVAAVAGLVRTGDIQSATPEVYAVLRSAAPATTDDLCELLNERTWPWMSRGTVDRMVRKGKAEHPSQVRRHYASEAHAA